MDNKSLFDQIQNAWPSAKLSISGSEPHWMVSAEIAGKCFALEYVKDEGFGVDKLDSNSSYFNSGYANVFQTEAEVMDWLSRQIV